MESLEKPIISRHGTKGGRFIDGMYTCDQGLQKITGISLIPDSGIFSDHVLVVTKINLGIEILEVNKEQEECIDFKRIMNIPVRYKTGDNHPCINEQVYKGAEFAIHAKLYNDLQKITNESSNGFQDRITLIHSQLEQFEKGVIDRTTTTISSEEQLAGKLVKRTPLDAKRINTASHEFFTLINDVCRVAGLASMVAFVQSSSSQKKCNEIITGKSMLPTTSFAISKQLDDSTKRARSICQQISILLRSLAMSKRIQTQQQQITHKPTSVWMKCVSLNIQRLSNQYGPFMASICATVSICSQTKEKRMHHTEAIEMGRNRKIYNNDNKYIDTVISNQGRKEYDQFINDTKKKSLETK